VLGRDLAKEEKVRGVKCWSVGKKGGSKKAQRAFRQLTGANIQDVGPGEGDADKEGKRGRGGTSCHLRSRTG